ncbi:MAG TPA: ABC-2 family transporter protein [Opitutaceae bacterium]|nr:ABC-2 family transporter protein [Opitutaceae bacterium]
MLSAFDKYRHAFLVGLQSNIVYRWNFLIRAFFSLFQLAVVFILWGAVFSGTPRVGGFDLPSTITYFVVLVVLQFFIGAFNEDYQISEDIRNGLINQFLLKPINYFGYRFSVFTSARLVSGSLMLVPLLVLFPFVRDHLSLPSLVAWRVGLGLPAVALAALIQFSIAYCFGLLTFWFLEIQGFVILSMAVEALLGGQMFPLDLLPPRLLRIAEYLPFYYQMYFPAAIFTGRIDEPRAVAGLALQAGWAVALLALTQVLWTRGLRRHTAVGG